MKTYIFSDVCKESSIGNVHFTGTVKNANEAMSKSFCVIIPIKDATISAGQTLLLTAMTMKKPVIITESDGLTKDYVKNYFNGIIIKKSKEELVNAIQYLKNEKNYNDISINSYNEWKTKYSIYSMGENISKFILTL